MLAIRSLAGQVESAGGKIFPFLFSNNESCIQNTHMAMILPQVRLRFLYYQFTVDFGILCIDIKFYRI